MLTAVSAFAGIGGFDRGFQIAGIHTSTQIEWDQHCQTVLKKQFPHANLMGDICHVRGSDVGRAEIFTGGFPCFVAGTLITTEQGLRPIETLSVGDLVLTHERRWRPIVQTMSRSNAPTIKVRTLGARLLTTAEHPFYVRTKARIWNAKLRRYERTWSKPEWLAAKDLTTAHFVGMPIDAPLCNEGQGISDAKAYLVGRWLGDGWIIDHPRQGRANSRMRKVMVCCAHTEADVLAASIAEAGYHATRVSERTVVKFHISSTELVKFLEPFGRGARHKTLAEWAFNLPRSEQEALLQGWIDADGSRRRDRKTTRVTTTSRHLAYGMARLARNCRDVAVCLHEQEVPKETIIEGRTVRQHRQYVVSINDKNREAFVEDGFAWTPVREVADTHELSTVYNIGVQEDESYTANGVTVHNCQDTSIAAPNRAGLAGSRSSHFYEFARLIDEYQRLIEELGPRWVVIENPTGLLKSNAGRDMATVVRCLEELGYGWAYRVVDGRHFGSPQRRQRVLMVGHRGGESGPAWRVLGDTDRGGEADPARGVGRRPLGSAPAGGAAFDAVWRKSARPRASLAKGGYETWVGDGLGNTLTGFDGGGPARQTHLIAQHGRVRTLTLTEWERLQLFPDGWTEGIPPSARYTALGNAMHVGMATWLGGRIVSVDRELQLTPTS